MRLIFPDSAGGAQFVLVYYVPIYFQAILGTSAQDSGVRNLPYILGSSKLETPLMIFQGENVFQAVCLADSTPRAI